MISENTSGKVMSFDKNEALTPDPLVDKSTGIMRTLSNLRAVIIDKKCVRGER
jgi:hypothetical protein